MEIKGPLGGAGGKQSVTHEDGVHAFDLLSSPIGHNLSDLL